MGEADLRDGGSHPSGSLFQCWIIPHTLGVRGQYVFLPHLGSWGGECKCGKGEFTPKAAFQNLGQSLGIPERRGKDYLFLGEEEGHRGEGRG